MEYTVVVAEDEILLQKSLVKKIEKLDSGFHVIGQTQTGIQALELIEQYNPFLLITDIRMPVMDGLELIEKARETHPELSCVIVSGYSEFEYAQRAIRLRVDDYLLKPVDTGQLKEVLDRIRARYAAEKQKIGESFREAACEMTPEHTAEMVHDYITSHYQEDVNLNLVAGEFSYSPGYLVKMYQARYGQSPSQYLIHLRINRARQMLEQNTFSIRQVGEAVGYPDQAYFSRIFKKYVGVSPQKYREGEPAVSENSIHNS